MKNFSDFKIAPTQKSFTGDKIKIDRVLNRPIAVHEFRLVDSKFEKGNKNGKCLHLQIYLGETPHVLFTGSITLMEMIQQVPREDFPFSTTVIKRNECYVFT